MSSRAFEISDFHKREPPPKEILEDVSAKGGDLLKRTVENYARRSSKIERDLGVGGPEAESSDVDRDRSPKQEKMDVDEPASAGRIQRGEMVPASRL